MQFKPNRNHLFCLTASILALGVVTAQAEPLRNPRLQRTLPYLEQAMGHLDAAQQHAPRDVRDEARAISQHVQTAMEEINRTLESLHVRRQTPAGHAEPSAMPIHSARDALKHALDEFTTGMRDEDFKGHLRVALGELHHAMDDTARLAEREHAMHAEAPIPAPPAPPAVIERHEMGHPHLQRALQRLEIARDQLDYAQGHGPRIMRDKAAQAMGDVDSAIHETINSLEAVGTPRTIEHGHGERTDHPLHAAREALEAAAAELAAVGHAAHEDFHGHERRALDQTHISLDEVQKLEHREGEFHYH